MTERRYPVLRQSRARATEPLILIGVAAACWAVTTIRMQGMDVMSRTDLGALGWFAGIWATMMAAMMLPSLMPVAVSRGRASTLLFSTGYLIAWSATGLLAYVLIEGVGPVAPGWLATYLPGAILLGGAAYELTPLKRACLRRCRAGMPAPSRSRPAPIAPLLNGVGHAGYCIGCCWGLMAALFALGVMSIASMAVIAAVVAVEKLVPWADASRHGTAALLAALGVAALV